ncbi:hypothetical protein AVEN_241412-1 [Araneus ventricosus]|uniref:Peptidase S1 domain-containing protein n=1 Tax=Araneus ventricosus TaxID=182803 RepID=A0A4Y2M4Q0_ARAVE|nr:hypothetical protein AVEN_241412-1 [Araneus ventricosus]
MHYFFPLSKAYERHPRCSGRRVHRSCYISPNTIKVGLLGTQQRTPSETLAVSRIITHPMYSYSLQINDVALLQLARPVRCSAYNMPVCLPPRDFQRIGTSLITAGYGFNTPEGIVGPQVLREGVVREIDPRNCVLTDKQPRNVVKNIICAAGMESVQSSCFVSK